MTCPKFMCPSRCSPDLRGLPIQPTCPSSSPILTIIGEAPGCFTNGGVEVLTPQGWIPLSGYVLGTPVAQYHMDGSIEFAIPSRYISSNYNGPTVCLSGRVETSVTPNHKFLVHNKYHKKFLIETAEELRVNYTGQSVPISGEKRLGSTWDTDLIRIVVAVQADGTYDKTGIRFEFTKERKKGRIVQLLQRLGCEYRVGSDNSKGSLRITIPYSDPIAQSVMLLMPDKLLPWSLLQLNMYGLQVVMEELHHWDGYRDNRSSTHICEEFSSGKVHNLDVVQAITHLVGKRGFISFGYKGTGRVTVSSHHKAEVRSIKKSYGYHIGRVYCLTVPSGYFMVRSNGKVFITGNSDEDRQGRFFVGKAGQEMDNYLSRAGIPRDRCYITNILKCHPPGDRDPKVHEIATCSSLLLDELDRIRPHFIATVGRFATQFFLGDVNMEMVHGIPYRVNSFTSPSYPITIIPVYHPSAGLHDTTNMSNIMADFLSVRAAMSGQIPVRESGKYVIPPSYHVLEEGEDPTPYLSELVAIDTETQDEEDNPYCLQFCCGDIGHVIMWDNYLSLAIFANHVADPEVLCIIHNSLFDLKVLSKMGVEPAKMVDTMIMAYLLQTEPQGLKPLTFRHLGVKMDEYGDIVKPYTRSMAIAYLEKASKIDWGKLPPVLEMKSGQPKVRQPQPINQKIRRILKDVEEGKTDKDGDLVDPFDRWHKTPLTSGRSMVEEAMGRMRKAYLQDVPAPIAMQYAATDPWATYHIYPILKAKIDALDLNGPLERDIGVVPMVECMQRHGMLLDPPHFDRLKSEFQAEMDTVHRDIESLVGPIWPGSDPQVLDLVDRLGLVQVRTKRVNGKEVKIRKKMVDVAAMELIKDLHPVVPKLMRWRVLAKLVDSFINVLLEKKGPDNRIRTTLRITRVVTGRLSSSDPNLMAMPTRSEDGRKIREGFIARPGYKLYSGDYAQVEMRVVAHISQDPNMMEVFITDQDLHTFTAAGMFRIDPADVDEMKHRYPAKRVGFGVLNLISARKLLKEFQVGGAEGWTEIGCQKVINDWFNLYQGIKAYVEDRKVEARRTGMVRDWAGRMRLIPEIMSVHPHIVEAGIRQAVNAPIQMGAQAVIKEAMRQLVPLYQSFGEDVITPLIQIHDDIVWEIRDDIADTVLPLIKYTMENCVPLTVPLKVDFKCGTIWGKMSKIKW